jgi:hypothetical protein
MNRSHDILFGLILSTIYLALVGTMVYAAIKMVVGFSRIIGV